MYELDPEYLTDDACAEHDLRQIQAYLRQIESSNAYAAMARAEREINHDIYRLRTLLEELGFGEPTASDYAVYMEAES